MATTISNSTVNFNDSTQQGTAYVGIKSTIFTSNGTFTIPTGVNRIKITAVGGGGGSSGANTSNPTHSTGGGGGGTSIKWLSVTPGLFDVIVTVGIGGNGSVSSNTSGFQGGSSIATYGGSQYVFGAGGSGGPFGSGLSGGAGGSASQGDINFLGGQGTGAGLSVAGGGSFFSPQVFPTAAQTNGLLYGGGAPRRNGTQSGNGGSGANGVVIIEY